MHSTVLVLTLTALLVVLVPIHGTGSGSGCIYYNSFKGYDCTGKNFQTIPEHLKSSTEVLDASFNRIRELSKDMFLKYPYLKKLYLNDNMIMTIEPDTFDNLSDLDTLDLSMNALVELPSSILHLPSLKGLMLAKNIRLDILSLFRNAGAVTAPLQKLDISFNPLMSQLPQFGVMMDLVELNITGNHVTNVSKAHFTGLCNLKLFIHVNLTMEFATACDCAQIHRRFSLNKLTSIPEFQDRCGFAAEKCTEEDIEPSAYELAIHKKCIADFQVRETLRSASQICLIVFGTIGGILLVVGVCYVYYRFQRLPDADDKNKNVKTTDFMTKTNLLIKDDLNNC